MLLRECQEDTPQHCSVLSRGEGELCTNLDWQRCENVRNCRPTRTTVRRTRPMITKFDSSYVGSVDLENAGYSGTPINDRHYPNQELASERHKAMPYAKQMDTQAYDTSHMAKPHFHP